MAKNKQTKKQTKKVKPREDGPPPGGCPKGYYWNGKSCVEDVG